MFVLLTSSVLKQRELPATVSSFHVSFLYTAMLRTSIAAVVLGCFYFCPLDCDASVMVVDCAAVETGCKLEKYVTSPVLLLSFASILLLLLRLRRDACRKKQTKNATLSFLVAALLLLFTHRRGCAEKNKIGFCFLFDTGTQSVAFSVTGYVLLLFLTAPGSCLHQY